MSQAAPLRQSRTAIGIVPLKNGQGDNLSPSNFREKTQKEAHTKRFISVQKLQAETERGSIFYRTFKVTRPSFFGGVPSYFEALWYPHLYFYRKSNTKNG